MDDAVRQVSKSLGDIGEHLDGQPSAETCVARLVQQVPQRLLSPRHDDDPGILGLALVDDGYHVSSIAKLHEQQLALRPGSLPDDFTAACSPSQEAAYTWPKPRPRGAPRSSRSCQVEALSRALRSLSRTCRN